MKRNYLKIIIIIGLIIGLPNIIDDIERGPEKYYHQDTIVVNEIHENEFGAAINVARLWYIIDEQGRDFKIHEDAYKKLMKVYDNNPVGHTLIIHHHEGGKHHSNPYLVDNITTESGIVISNY